MNDDSLLHEFKEADALLSGHFVLSSGLHSDTYIQCARALIDPKRAERLCEALASKLKAAVDINTLDAIVAPAMGGLIVGYELARQLNKPSMFCERVNGTFTLRRGFTLQPNEKVLVVEDVVTTGKSSQETFDCIRAYGAEVLAEASLINRNKGTNPVAPVPLTSLLELEIASYTEDELPDHLRESPVEKPGSRFLTSG